jgi:DeoR/GlpR family transcriptional regulator of sugar metabolism
VKEGQVADSRFRHHHHRDRPRPAQFQNLTIITNAVNIAAELSGTSVEVILTGGTLRKNSFSLVGPIAEETLRRLSADLLFLGVDGFDVHFGLSTPESAWKQKSTA